MQDKHEIDMCHGPLLKKTLLFAVPLMLSGILQLLFSAADLAIVGRFTGSEALAAVGATGSVSHFLINIFMGFSVSANVLVARYYGARDPDNVSSAAGNSMAVGLAGGMVIGVIGVWLSRPLLVLMQTPAEVLDQAVLYMRIYFCGMPVIAIYNFGSAVLRAVGDTRRPLLFLTLAGVVNVGLNLLLTVGFDMGVAGVAIATVVSEGFSAGMVLLVLLKPGKWYSITKQSLRPKRNIMIQMAQIGIPSGICGSLFSLSNSVIQSSVNFFGADVVAGNSAANNLDGFLWTATDAVANSALAFTSQNLGAGQYDRIRRVFAINILIVVVLSVLGGAAMVIFGEDLLSIYTDSAAAVRGGAVRLTVMGSTYITAGIMNVMLGMVRGMGYSTLPTMVSLSGVCGLRLVWIGSYFARHKTLEALYASYPLSWTVTALILLLCYAVIMRRVKKGRLPRSVRTGS